MERKPFKVSTGLKDLIGRDLITDDFVAVFELVKNSFDAHARHVRILFEADRIVIADDGKGMSREDITQKWLFVAYSAKREGTEDADYRNRVGERSRPFAGAKGVGRFSCDRLGTDLLLASRARGQPTQLLAVNWTLFEKDPHQEFGKIMVGLDEVDDFPDRTLKPKGATGTIIEIRNLRSSWDRAKLQFLKRELTKLIDPFSAPDSEFAIEIAVPSEAENDARDSEYNNNRRDGQQPKVIVNGLVENPILDAIGQRTTSLRVRLIDDGNTIETTLDDRGELIYKIHEPNTYAGLKQTDLKGDIFYLNRSAKYVFAHRMGLASIAFGSIFLFRNGFRVFPIGAEDDDFFGLNRRKQQGQRRFLGGRDLIGRVDIRGADGFDEATSRNQGLIRTQHVEDLINFIQLKCVRRLERYVVDISWKDKFDQDAEDLSRIRTDESSALVMRLVSRLVATEGVQLIDFNPDLIRIIDEKSDVFESSLKALELIAEQIGDSTLLSQVDDARTRMRALESAEADAREAELRAELRARAAEAKTKAAEHELTQEKQRNSFLVAASTLDQDTILNLHHQIILQASDVHHGVERMMRRLRSGPEVSKDEWIAFLEQISLRNNQILTAAKFATKGGYKQQSGELFADLQGYIKDYIETVSVLWAPAGIAVSCEGDGVEFQCQFRPIDIGIVIDNLVVNAKKADASRITFYLNVTKGASRDLVIDVADNGFGWPENVSLAQLFNKGFTTTDGSGLGLPHVKQVVERLRGFIEPVAEPYSSDMDGAHLTIRIPS